MKSQKSSDIISQIYTSRINILDLMLKQNYNVNDYANCSINEVNTMKQNDQLDMLLETSDDKINAKNPKKKIYIRYFLNSRIVAKNIQELIDDLFITTETLDKTTDSIFIIIKDNPNETLINEIKHIWESEGIFIVVESIKKLQFNILQHVYVPNHIVLHESEVIEIMNKYNITDKNQFPEISRFDPVAQVIGLRPGQVCRIIRSSKTAIQSNYYRLCLNN